MGPELKNIKAALANSDSSPRPEQDRPEASVAAILHQSGSGLQLLFIRRSQREGDPWSGHLAFPGGRLERHDENARSAAERETLEEIGLRLDPDLCLGSLLPLTGLRLPISVSAHVYWIEVAPSFHYSSEVETAFWIPLNQLKNPRHQTEFIHTEGSRISRFPAIKILSSQNPVLWGITYRFTIQLLDMSQANPLPAGLA